MVTQTRTEAVLSLTIAALLFRFALAAVFGHAGAVKLVDLGDFRLAVRNYQLVPERLLGFVVVGLPIVELACAAALIVGIGTGPVAAMLVLVLAAFVFAIGINLLRGRTFSCGCSGRTSSDITWRHVIVNAGLALLAVLVSVWAVQPLTLAAGWGITSGPALSPGQAFAVLLAAVVAAVTVLLVSDAVAARRVMSGLPSPAADRPVPIPSDSFSEVSG